MRCLVGSEWGADRVALKLIYCGLIRSVLNYVSVAYGSAENTALQKLNRIQHEALRLCTGAFKTTPVAALQVEMGEMGLQLRKMQLSTNYWINLQGHEQDHPTQYVLDPCWEKGKKGMRSFGWTAVEKAKELGVDQLRVSPIVPLAAIPPWLLPDAKVDLTLLGKNNNRSTQQCIDSCYECVQIYTDASRSSANKVWVAFVIPVISHFTAQSFREQERRPSRNPASAVKNSDEGSVSSVYLGTSTQWSDGE